MNHPYGIYEVVGPREYRGHKTGETFVARIDIHAARRAIDRGDIVLVEHVRPTIDAERLALPKGWLDE